MPAKASGDSNSKFGKRGGRAAAMASSGAGFKDLKATLSKEGRGSDTAGLAAYIAAKAIGRGQLEKLANAGRKKK